MRDIPDLAVDGTNEIADLLLPWAREVWYDFAKVDLRRDRIYLVGRDQLRVNRDRVHDAIAAGHRVVISNPFEGSDTLRKDLMARGLEPQALAGQMLVISGGDMDPSWPHMTYDLFATKIHDFEENWRECARTREIYQPRSKPYSFLFLNGRGRIHRKWLLEYFLDHDLLDQAIWSWLDPAAHFGTGLTYQKHDANLMLEQRPIQVLAAHYEVDRYRAFAQDLEPGNFAKYQLFNREWGEVYINAEPYIDTYFSVVTETVFGYPYSFRTEKIWKPIAMGHPWICCANQGFYRDMHELGFQTFGHVIDESFDLIADDQARIQRLAEIVSDLCQQDLGSFLGSCESVCKYNQQHLLAMRDRIPAEFPQRFSRFLRQHGWMI